MLPTPGESARIAALWKPQVPDRDYPMSTHAPTRLGHREAIKVTGRHHPRRESDPAAEAKPNPHQRHRFCPFYSGAA